MINYRAPAFACVGLMVGFMGKLIASALQAKRKNFPASYWRLHLAALAPLSRPRVAKRISGEMKKVVMLKIQLH